MMNKKKLLKTRFAQVVKEAIEKGELDHFNLYSWTVNYNSGMEDKTLLQEVEFLFYHFI